MEMMKKVKKNSTRPIINPVKQPVKLLAIAIALLIFNVFAFSLVSADEIKYHDGSRRDPFIPLVGPDGIVAKKVSSSDLVIEGIITDPGGSSIAVINGELYKAGDHIDEALIVQVFADRVVFAQEDEEKIVWLREEHKK